ncbi:hypothetical protein A5731_12925 [Mycolicibacterium conceptionense]|uniref:hypothetical protein n=1 Tax=Mycolicibacterium conceptionense TaxID=451644 RepID=UPI0007EB7713|nr:hypothetical protein [Mycolicibacterium conceptionense]OBB14685.1 hypothetical protein A5718_30365 [Mycolicibacterium conceptionense]OBF03393.1 hypothetical protein A5731_12925 [Mycolicibacterium conceptionense]
MKSTVIERIWRRFCRSPQTDPTLTIATPAAALDASAQLLNNACTRSVAVALWSNMACRPLAALLYTASPSGNAGAMPWVRATAASLRHPDGWDTAADACAAVNPLLTEWLTPPGFDHRQRLSIAEALTEATHR